MIKTLTLTPEILAALAAVRRAEQTYVPGVVSAAKIEIPKLDLADALLRALAEQADAARVARLAQLPKAKPVPVIVEVALRRKWRRGER